MKFDLYYTTWYKGQRQVGGAMRPSQSRTSQHLGAGLGKITLDRVVSRSPEDSPFSRRSTLVGTPAGSLSLPPSKTSRVAFQHLSRSVLSLYQYPIAIYNQGTEEFWKWVPFSARERARRKWKWPSQRPKRSFLQHLLLSSGDIPLKSGSLFPMVWEFLMFNGFLFFFFFFFFFFNGNLQ